MADRWPLANGNWSNAANWNGGTLPAAGDDVFADGKTVTIDQDVTVLSVRTTQRSGGTAGGSFVHSGGYTLTADVYIRVNNTINNFSNNSQIIGNIYGNEINSQLNGITCNGNAKITGNITHFYNAAGTVVLVKTGGGTLEIIGNLSISNGNSAVVFTHSSTTVGSTVILTGNCTGGASNGTPAFSVNNTSGGTITEITGNLIGSDTSVNSYGLGVTQGFATVTVYGNSIGGSAAVGTLVSGASTVTIEKATANSSPSTTSVAGVSCTSSTATVVVREAEFGANGQTPLAGFIRFENSINNKITVTKEDDSTVTLIDINDASVYLPAEADVRDGVLYDPDLASEGTLIVPDPSNVRNGVPTDNTVGTADLTAQDFFDAIASSSDPIAIRLRNVATVETTGDQISAFNV
jgi:hypothetical protein